MLALVVALLWVGPYLRSRRGVGVSAKGDYPFGQEQGGIGTTGRTERVAPPGNANATLHELESLTGVNDQNELIGHRVDFDVKVADINNAGSFWIGNGDNLALVVLGRDNRTPAQRDRGAPSANNIQPVKAGQMVHVTGTIEKIPYAEARYSWGLADSQHQNIERLKVYIRADSVAPIG